MNDAHTNTTWTKRYTPGTAHTWKGRCDGGDSKRFHEVIQKVDLKKQLPKLKSPAFGLVGFACDEGVKRNLGRPGAHLGPENLRNALAKMPLHLADRCSILDVGDISCEDGRLSLSQEALSTVIAQLMTKKIHPIALGGGHEIALGSYQGILEAYPNKSIAILNFDAHFDLRPLSEGRGTSGTPFTQMANILKSQNIPFHYTCIGIQRYGNTKMLFNAAKNLHVSYLYADEIHLKGWETGLKLVQELLEQQELIYVTLCLDVFSSSVAPGVSAPQPLGLLPWQVIPMLRVLAQSKKVVCLDIAELNPAHDLNNITADLAATLISDYIHHRGAL